MNCSLFHNDMTFPRHPICHMYLSEKYVTKKTPKIKASTEPKLLVTQFLILNHHKLCINYNLKKKQIHYARSDSYCLTLFQ